MLRVDYRRTPRRVTRRALWTRATSQEVLDHIATAVRATTARGDGMDGRPLGVYAGGPRAGQPITLRETGAMMRSLAAIRLDAAGGQLAFRAPHARYVLRRRPGGIGLPGDIGAFVTALFKRALDTQR